MRPNRATLVLLALLLANAAAILFFRFFITVDGPTHVLHASLLDAPWTTPGHLAHGITYDSDALHVWLGDRVLMLLLLFSTPEQAHDLFAAIVSCAVVLSVVAFLRAHGTRMGLAILWLAPLTFNVLLFMGLFHFLLGVAVALGTVAWWKWRAASPFARWAGLLIGLAIALYTHRGSPILLGVLFLPAFVIELAQGRTIAVVGRRNLRWGLVLILALVAVVVFQLQKVLQGIQPPIPVGLPTFDADLLLRPLLLPGLAQGPWPVWGIGILLLIAAGAGAWSRWRMGRKLFAHDALLILIVLFTTIGWLGNTPLGRQLLIAERCQWLALVALAMWLVAIADVHSGLVSKLIGIAAMLSLPLHVVRIVRAEGSFYQLQRTHDQAIEASAALEPDGLVLSVTTGPNALLQHLEAYVAVRHSGILLTANEGLQFKDILPTTDVRLIGMAQDRHWLVRHWRTGIPPEVDQVLFIGSDIERGVNKHPWPVLLEGRYKVSFDSGHARTYTADRNE